MREGWLVDSIEKQEPQPLEAYDIVSDLSVDGKGIPWDKLDPSEEAVESISSEVRTPFLHSCKHSICKWSLLIQSNYFC